MRISVVIPTFRRPANLLWCLEALRRQEREPDEVLVAVRDDDAATWAALIPWNRGKLPLRLVSAGHLNASEARNRCLDRAIGGVIAMTDDDTMPRPEWLARIHDRFESDPRLGGLGGPDWIGGKETPEQYRADVVGRIRWWGRRVGNHHRGSHAALEVEWLKGANMAFRREAIRDIRFGHQLRGPAAQFGEDLAVSLELTAGDWKLVYDPAVEVDHFPGDLPGIGDHRALSDPVSLLDASHNETAVLLGYLPPARRRAFLLWATVVGTRLLPGGLVAIYQVVTQGRSTALKRCAVVLRGRLAGWRTWQSTLLADPDSRLPASVSENQEPATSP